MSDMKIVALYAQRRVVSVEEIQRNGGLAYDVTDVDGTVSVVDKDKFDAAFVAIGKFSAPVDQDLSGNHYYFRLRGEREVLVNDINKLSAYVNSPNIHKVSEEAAGLLRKQLVIMRDLRELLDERLRAASGTLDESWRVIVDAPKKKA